MKFNDELMSLDYLIFSSHKTATQTLVKTLRNNGYNCIHCHVLNNIGMQNGTFESYTNEYYLKHKKKINIITVFRDPIERHISSFFQWYGTKPIRDKDVDSELDTIIYKKTVIELQNKLFDEINNKTLVGQEESIEQICNELKIEIDDLNYDFEKNYGLYENERVRLYIFRFDILIKRIDSLLTQITCKKILRHSSNKSSTKWYFDIYSEFIGSINIPHEIITKVYFSRRDLIELFYSESYESILNKALIKYGNMT